MNESSRENSSQPTSPVLPPHGSARGEISDVAVENSNGGIQVRWKATVEGYKDETLRLRWTLYDASALSPVSDAQFQDQVGAALEPEFDVDQGSDRFSIPAPTYEGTYYVRLELIPPNAAPLDSQK